MNAKRSQGKPLENRGNLDKPVSDSKSNSSYPATSERAVFNLLWDMWHQLDDYDGFKERITYGTIISHYAGVIEDRINNSGYSRSVDSLKLYTTAQLKAEIESRKS
jgi:hypothetical protein